jgi:mannan endo-1,4-beta-mannosidase
VAMYTKPETLRTLLEEIESDGTVGANWWAVRFHNRDGGFYKHSDRGSQFEDLNWPGFETERVQLPEIARERELLGILREHATRISGLPAPAEQVPGAPTFLPAADVGHLSWQGSTGASSYQVQRSSGAGGPWMTLEGAYTDNLVVYAPLFSDRTAKLGGTYYYRVIARNRAGASQPSNIVGPVRAQRLWWIDDLFDLSLADPSSRNATVETAYAHDVYLEDIGVGLRKDPSQSAAFIYRVPGAIRHFSVFVHETDIAPHFYLGTAAAAEEVMPKATPFNQGRRTRYDFERAGGNETVLEIRLAADASPKQALSRVEIAFE